MCEEVKEEVCEQEQDDEGNFVDTDDCQELEKTVCDEVATPEEVCNSIKIQ